MTLIIKVTLLLAVSSLLFVQASAGARFLAPPLVANRTFHAPELLCTGAQPSKVQGRLLCLAQVVSKLNLTAAQIRANYSGSILLISTANLLDADLLPFHRFGEPERSILDVISQLNLTAIFLWNSSARVGATTEILFADRSWCPLAGLPILETGLNSAADLNSICDTYAGTDQIIVELTAGDPNDWMYLKRGWFLVVWRIVATLLCAASGVVAGAKLIGYVRNDGVQLTIPQLTLGLQFIAALFRIGIVSTDPIYAGNAFNSVSAHMTSTISFPINFVTLLLLAMYWSEILDASKIRFTSFLNRLRIPFIIACVILVIAEIVSTLLRAIRFGIKVSVATTVAAVIYVIFMLAVTIFFFVYGARVIQRLRQSKALTNIKGAMNKSSRRNKSLRRLTVMLLVTGIFNIIFIIAFVIAAVESFFYTPTGFHLSWTLMYIGVLGGSLTQVIAVKWPFRLGGTPSTSVKGGASTTASGSKSGDTITQETTPQPAPGDESMTGEE